MMPPPKTSMALAFDITAAEEGEDGEIDIPFGLFTLDKATGEATLIGYQDYEMLYTLAASPEGQLVALSSGGTLWNLSKLSGELAEETGMPNNCLPPCNR